MSTQPITRDIMLNIYKNGTYYNPAKKHYGVDSVNIVCDRCYKNNLDICIGWVSYDLCLSCVQAIHREVNRGEFPEIIETKKPEILSKMLQSQFREDAIKTYMMQDQFREYSIKTLMMQNQFRENDTKLRMMQNQFRKN